MNKVKIAKCKLKQCILNEKGKCFMDGPFIIRLTPNSIQCNLFENDFDKSVEQYLAQGGTLGALARKKGRKTDKELKEVKKAKRKPRSDKGTTKSKKKKKGSNSLKDLM